MYVELYGIVIILEPLNMIVGAVRSDTTTVLFCVMAGLFELSATL